MGDIKKMKHPIETLHFARPSELYANDYNPNHVAGPERKLLKLSLMEDGWTQPIVCNEVGEIIDGFHRWTLASEDPRLTINGKIPVVILPKTREDRMLSTIRHNRARGSHNIIQMGKISQHLQGEMANEEIQTRLGMEAEELERLTDNVLMFDDHGGGDYGPSWIPSFDEKSPDELKDNDIL